MPKSAPTKSLSDVLQEIAEGIRQAARSPDIHGYIPHPKQVDFHNMENKIRLFIGGNRSGKTVAGAAEAVWWATGTHPYRRTPEPPVRGRIISVDFKHGVENIVKPELMRWMPPSALINGSWEDSYSKEFHKLTLTNKSTIEFMSYEQELEKFAGTSRHFIWFDEEPPQSIFTENKLRTVDVSGSLWLTMTPVEGLTWTYDEIYAKAGIEPAFGAVEVDMGDNTYLSEAEMQEILDTLTEDEREARVHGKYVAIGGLIYKRFDPLKHVIDPFIPPKTWLHFRMMDHGYNNPTAWLWGAVNPDGEIFIYEEHYRNGKVVAWHAEKVKNKTQELGVAPLYSVGDPSIRNVDPITGTSIQLEYIEHGVPIILGNNDVKAGLIRTAGYFEGITNEAGEIQRPKLYITRNCSNLIWELRRYRWGSWANKKMRDQRNAKEEPNKKDDHAVDALRYGVMSRPEMDSGTAVPSYDTLSAAVNEAVGVSTAINPSTGLIDEGLKRSSRRRIVDTHLGEDF